MYELTTHALTRQVNLIEEVYIVIKLKLTLKMTKVVGTDDLDKSETIKFETQAILNDDMDKEVVQEIMDGIRESYSMKVKQSKWATLYYTARYRDCESEEFQSHDGYVELISYTNAVRAEKKLPQDLVKFVADDIYVTLDYLKGKRSSFDLQQLLEAENHVLEIER